MDGGLDKRKDTFLAGFGSKFRDIGLILVASDQVVEEWPQIVLVFQRSKRQLDDCMLQPRFLCIARVGGCRITIARFECLLAKKSLLPSVKKIVPD
jgi:hypothetical protein